MPARVSMIAREHPYRSLKLPPNAPFELRPSPNKGWGCFATRAIKENELILHEKPLFVIRSGYDFDELDVMMAASEQMGPEERHQFKCLRPTSFYQALCDNFFGVSLISGRDPTDVIGRTLPGMFALHARFNHSCIPNIRLPGSRDEIVDSYANRDIEAGEELLFCYRGDLKDMIRRDRAEVLGAKFVCDCKACAVGTEFQIMSDLRRRLIRGLKYLTYGWDINTKKDNSAKPLIFDRELKKQAEEFRQPLTSRLIYVLLVALLLEQEGIIQDDDRKTADGSAENMVSFLETPMNVRIGELVLRQGSYLAKVCSAFRLYGKEDAGDAEYAEVHRRAADRRHHHGCSCACG